MDLRHQFALLRHWAWLGVMCMVLGGTAAYLVSSGLPNSYEARATLIIGQALTAANPEYTQVLTSERLSQTYANLARTGPVMQRVIDTLGLQRAPDKLRDHVSAQAPANGTLVYITVSDGSPATAASIANAVANELIVESPAEQGGQADLLLFVDQQLKDTKTQIETTQASITALAALLTRTPEQDALVRTLQDQLVQLRSVYTSLLAYSSSSAPNLVTVVDPAVTPTDPSGPKILLNTALGAIAGLLFAAAFAFLVEHLDDTVRSPEAVAAATSLPIVGSLRRIPTKRNGPRALIATEDSAAAATEAFRAVRTNLEFAPVDEPIRSLLVTSAIPREGKTTIASNLAVVFAQSGKKVVLLDGNLRAPGIHRMFGLSNSSGLADLLQSSKVGLNVVMHAIPDLKLEVVPAGPVPANPAELLASDEMKELIKRLSGDCDLLLVDGPALQSFTDAAVLSAIVDGTLLVIEGHTPREQLHQAAQALARVGAQVLGAVTNEVPAGDRKGRSMVARIRRRPPRHAGGETESADQASAS